MKKTFFINMLANPPRPRIILTVLFVACLALAAGPAFSEELPELTISMKGKGSTSPETGIHSYPPGTTITITAIPDDGWQFDGWTGDVPEPESALIVITVEANKNITANFSQTTPNQSLYIFIIAGIIACGIIAWLTIRTQTGKKLSKR